MENAWVNLILEGKSEGQIYSNEGLESAEARSIWLPLPSHDLHVRFGLKADICSAKRYVRFTPESGHVRRTRSCLLWANSGHGDVTIRSLHPRWRLSLAAPQ